MRRSRSAAVAYRADLASRGFVPFGTEDGVWLQVAALLNHSHLPNHDGRLDALRTALALAEQSLRGAGTQTSVGDPHVGEHSDESDLRRLIRFAEVVEEAGSLCLADVILECLVNLVRAETTRGAIFAQRARIARKRGYPDLARAQFENVEAVATRTRDDVLRIRAWIGYGALAQVAGNYPEMARWSRRAAMLARSRGFAYLESVARAGLFVRAARAGRFRLALLHARRMLQAAEGDSRMEGEVLANVGRLLLDAKSFPAAAATCSAVLVRTDAPRILLPALGGCAVAFARLGDDERAAWAVNEILNAGRTTRPPYEYAMALLDCVVALRVLGRTEDSKTVESQARHAANVLAAHEITASLDDLPVWPEPVAVSEVSPSIGDVVNAFADLAPETLPRHVLAETG